jgi:hypothetical protein
MSGSEYNFFAFFEYLIYPAFLSFIGPVKDLYVTISRELTGINFIPGGTVVW